MEINSTPDQSRTIACIISLPELGKRDDQLCHARYFRGWLRLPDVPWSHTFNPYKSFVLLIKFHYYISKKKTTISCRRETFDATRILWWLLYPNITFNLCIFTAVGCPDITAPENGWFKRTEDGASVGCTHSDEEWQLRCSGSSWVGHMGNCSASERDIFFKFTGAYLYYPIACYFTVETFNCPGNRCKLCIV